MNKHLRSFGMLLINCFLTGALSGQESSLIEIEHFGTNPGNLKMFIYVPEGIEQKENIPLVVALHGCSQKAQQMADESGWNKLADQHGFIVVYPQQKIVNNPSMCFNWFLKRNLDSLNGETASVKNMIDYAAMSYKIDTNRIFVYGLSAGAALCVSVMSNFPETINTGAIFGGAPYKVATNPFESTKAMLHPPVKTPAEWGSKLPLLTVKFPKLIVCHGTRDLVVDYQNGVELIKQWSFAHKVEPKPSFIDSAFAGSPIVNRQTYCKEHEEVITHYEFVGVGHVLLIEPGEAENQGGKTGVFAKNKGFHSTYFIAKDFGLLNEP
jgi:poly(hydroxyalkanoate) depolymerase family esterase